MSSKTVDMRRYRHPVWARGQSGVTIAIRYDLGYATVAEFDSDFGDLLPAGAMQSLSTALGMTGSATGTRAQQLAAAEAPWTVAIFVHRKKVIPRWVALVERAGKQEAVLRSN